MKELYNIGLTDDDIQNVLEICPTIKDLAAEEIINNIEILKSIDCNDRHIRNIIISNPYYLNRNNEDILNLIKKFIIIGISNINLFIDSNPYILNKDVYEIDEFIKIQNKKRKSIKDIVEDLESNPFIIEEL